MALALTPDLAAHFARTALSHVAREYPNKLDHTLHGAADLKGPRTLHPIFYGSFDWHSCVHGYWLLCRLYRGFPDLAEAGAIRQLVDAHVTPANVAAELAYLEQPRRASFERPYGWAWLLMLAAELARHVSPEGQRWSATLAPLTQAFVGRFLDFLPKATYPARVGTHFNSAFALALALDHADFSENRELAQLIRDKARSWYGEDADCQAWEPAGDDFLSPALIEAECMRRVLPAAEFAAWRDRFLPRLGLGLPATLFAPAIVSDRSDGKIVHLDGLNLSRAWCWRNLVATFGPDDPRRALALAAATAHIRSSLPHVTGDYMGEHWLATYAMLALAADPCEISR